MIKFYVILQKSVSVSSGSSLIAFFAIVPQFYWVLNSLQLPMDVVQLSRYNAGV